MSRDRLWLLLPACLGVLLGSPLSACALPLDLNQAISANSSNSVTVGKASGTTLSWAVLKALASEFSASPTTSDHLAFGWWDFRSLPGDNLTASAPLWAASREAVKDYDRGRPELSSWRPPSGSELPWQEGLFRGPSKPIPLIPPSSTGGHETEYALLVPLAGFVLDAGARLVQAKDLLTAAPYLGSLLRPP